MAIQRCFGEWYLKNKAIMDWSRLIKKEWRALVTFWFAVILPFKHENGNYFFKESWKGPKADLNKLTLLYPSFLKRIELPQLQKIWHEASVALCSADEVDIWGYSLPESDMAVRVLLNCLRFRSQAGDAQVTVHDKGDETLDRWRTFLGEKAIYKCEVLK